MGECSEPGAVLTPISPGDNVTLAVNELNEEECVEVQFVPPGNDASDKRGRVISIARSACGGERRSGLVNADEPNLPKICLEMGNGGLSAGKVDEAGMRRVKQLGVNHVLMGGPHMPWKVEELRSLMDKLKAGGLTLGNLMIGGFPKTLYGKPGRDEEIEKVKQSIAAAGKAGLPVIEYNFYAHRIVEGYYETTGRGGAGYTLFDYDRVKDLPPLSQEGAHDLEEMWSNITYFLKAVIPVAEKSNVRLALHPNDPPAPVSRGSKQIMGTLAGWKRLIEIVQSKSNGITFDCGVTREMEEDPVRKYAVFRFSGSHQPCPLPECPGTKAV